MVTTAAEQQESFETLVGEVIRLRPSWDVVNGARDQARLRAEAAPQDRVAERVTSWLTMLSQLGLFRDSGTPGVADR